ncbi:MAG: viroplasmin family protein [Tannerellaceae bacterium]|jgi:ribonuclease HI|nr:viroplasmin family protein [Tannerellaceae bacterium]
MPKGKYYVVWQGLNPGIYDSWEACRSQVKDQANAKYKAFPSREEAQEALEKGYQGYLSKRTSAKRTWGTGKEMTHKPIPDSLAVDAACSGNPGDMEYRGVYTATGEELFHVGPFRRGTNNVGEFLALVHGLALLKQRKSNLPIYSDSLNAMKWVKNRKSKTLLERTPENEPVFNLIERAEKWLKENTYTTPILKWDTAEWGEIPADFGRK